MNSEYMIEFIVKTNAEFQRGISDGHRGVKTLPSGSLVDSPAYARCLLAYMAGQYVAQAELGELDETISKCSGSLTKR